MRKALVAISIGVVALAARGRAEPDSQGQGPPSSGSSDTAVEIKTFMFMPKTLRVAVGSKVTWACNGSPTTVSIIA